MSGYKLYIFQLFALKSSILTAYYNPSIHYSAIAMFIFNLSSTNRMVESFNNDCEATSIKSEILAGSAILIRITKNKRKRRYMTGLWSI